MAESKDEGTDSESDWFDKDEEELLKEVKLKLDIKKKVSPTATQAVTEEYISTRAAKDQYVGSIAAAIAASGEQTSGSKVITSKLREVLRMAPLDAFLFMLTSQPDLFEGQITLNDPLDRVLVYLHIIARCSSLQLPEFHDQLLHKFISNEVLLDHIQSIAMKLFCKRYRALWTDEQKIDEVVGTIHGLLLQAYRAGIFTPKAFDLVRHMRRLIEISDCHAIVQRPLCIQLALTLANITAAADAASTTNGRERASINSKMPADEFYPTLEELSSALPSAEINERADNEEMDAGIDAAASVPEDRSFIGVADYIDIQKQHLRQDFMISLRECVQVLRETGSLDTLPQRKLYKDVEIILNTQFLDAQRHQLLFVDMLGINRKEMENPSNILRFALSQLKTGALLCFTTDSAIENLVLATVTYTEREILNEGYIGIEIGRQYNIGAIYGKPMLMFEAPAFFEPYSNVYNYLSACCIMNFPMKDYIVGDKRKVEKPAYLKANATYTCMGHSFNPLDQPPPDQLLLNNSQESAFSGALREEFCLIQGPPGTGKTHLSVQLVKTLMQNTKTPIVLVTYTNESLDKFLVQLSEYTTNIARFGSQTRIPAIAKFNVRRANEDNTLASPRLKRVYYMAKMELKAKFERLQTLITDFDGTEDSYQLVVGAQRVVRSALHKLNTVNTIFQYYMVRQKGIVAMTTTCAAKINFLFHLLKSPVVVFEEAAEILESHAIACLTPYTQHVIMIGDHQQLQPYTASIAYSRSVGLNESLFERLGRQRLTPHVLTTQYRMRAEIAALIHPTIYSHLLNAAVVDTYPNVRGMVKNVYFVTHEELESQAEHEPSKYNTFEVRQVTNLAMRLVVEAHHLPTDIAILSPYAQQVSRIAGKLSKVRNLNGIKIATVDSYQGLEANIVLLSLVRSNNNLDIGFLRDERRICVALSRAKHGLYMIGNMTMLAHRSPTFAAIRNTLISQDALGTHFPCVEPWLCAGMFDESEE